MSLNPYSKYKNVEVVWLGSIPSCWVLGRLKNLLQIRSGQDYKLVETDDETAIPVIGSGGQFTFATDYLYNGESVLLGRKGTIDKPLYINGKFWTVDTMFYSEILGSVSAKYVYYLATTIPFGFYSTSTALPSMSQFDLSNHQVAIPSIKEQTQIAQFLDHEVGKIDALIAEQEKLIALLKEKRQAVISHAVTKGLNPDAQMKDSGVEWLGQVPEHWSVPKVSHVFFLQSGDSITAAEIEEVGSYEVFGGNGLRGYTEKYNCEGTYNLIGRQGALCGNVHMVSGKFFASEHAIVVYPLKELDVAFYRYFLEFMNLGQYSTAAAQPGISVEVISQLRIAFPPAFEQNLISNFIHSNLSEIGQLQSECTDLINLLKERRSALISAAVTGKIDVRGWQPPAAQ